MSVRAVDLFAGWGGFTLGAESAGVEVIWAANHWPLAVRAHEMNHPRVPHACQDLRQADWTRLPAYDVLLASPACQGHSQASQPRRRLYHDAMRSTAWAVVDCADVTAPRAIVVENVVDFTRWTLYPVWRQALQHLGYHLSEHVVSATDHGVPQRRTRLLVVATKRAASIELPTGRAEPAFGPCLEPDAGGWRLVDDSTPRVRERVAKGRARCGRRFLSQHVTGHPGVPLDEPIRTITTKDQWILVDGDSYRPLTVREHARAMGFPDSYGWPAGVSRSDAIRGLGNAIPPPVARDAVAAVAAAA